MKPNRVLPILVGAVLASWVAPPATQARRTYSRQVKRFMQRDPLGITDPAGATMLGTKRLLLDQAEPVDGALRRSVGESVGHPSDQYADGMNAYAYVNANPLRYGDPSGELCLAMWACTGPVCTPAGLCTYWCPGPPVIIGSCTTPPPVSRPFTTFPISPLSPKPFLCCIIDITSVPCPPKLGCCRGSTGVAGFY